MYDVIRHMDQLRREFDHLFSSVSLPQRRTAFLPGRGARQYPLVAVKQDHDHLYVEALMPGVDPKTLEVSAIANTLTITGEKTRWPAGSPHAGEEAYHRYERAAGKFSRTVELPTEVADHGTSATYEKGVLRVRMPKSESAKPRRITVDVAA